MVEAVKLELGQGGTEDLLTQSSDVSGHTLLLLQFDWASPVPVAIDSPTKHY